METNFFQQIAALKITGQLIITIQPLEDRTALVSILLKNDTIKDPAAFKIPPLRLNGSAKELDEGFFASITTPIQKTNQLFCDMANHDKALESAKKESRMSKQKDEDNKKDKDQRKKKYDDQMKKVNDLEAQKKYGEAIGQMPDPKLYQEYAEQIKNKLDKLRSNHGSLSLFGEETPAAEILPSTTEDDSPHDDDDNEQVDFDPDDDNEENDDENENQ